MRAWCGLKNPADFRTAGARGYGRWLPDMDLNHDKQIQSLLCYRYTIGQTSAYRVGFSDGESRIVPA